MNLCECQLRTSDSYHKSVVLLIIVINVTTLILVSLLESEAENIKTVYGNCIYHCNYSVNLKSAGTNNN